MVSAALICIKIKTHKSIEVVQIVKEIEVFIFRLFIFIHDLFISNNCARVSVIF